MKPQSHAAARRAQRAAFRALGLCAWCGAVREDERSSACAHCREQLIAAAQRYRRSTRYQSAKLQRWIERIVANVND